MREWKARKGDKWKIKNIVVHKTLKRAQNEKQQSADNYAERSYPLTAISFFINFMSFTVKPDYAQGVSKMFQRMRELKARKGDKWKVKSEKSGKHYAQVVSNVSEWLSKMERDFFVSLRLRARNDFIGFAQTCTECPKWKAYDW